MMTLNRS